MTPFEQRARANYLYVCGPCHLEWGNETPARYPVYTVRHLDSLDEAFCIHYAMSDEAAALAIIGFAAKYNEENDHAD